MAMPTRRRLRALLPVLASKLVLNLVAGRVDHEVLPLILAVVPQRGVGGVSAGALAVENCGFGGRGSLSGVKMCGRGVEALVRRHRRVRGRCRGRHALASWPDWASRSAKLWWPFGRADFSAGDSFRCRQGTCGGSLVAPLPSAKLSLVLDAWTLLELPVAVVAVARAQDLHRVRSWRRAEEALQVLSLQRMRMMLLLIRALDVDRVDAVA